MPLAEIKQKYARRYEIYLKLLRAQGREDAGEPVLTDYDIAQMQKWLKGLNALDQYIATHKTGEAEILRERQVTIFEDLRDFIESGGKEGYVKLPTGIGKTVLFIELLEALDFKSIIVVPSIPLIEQTHERIEQFAPDLEVGKISGYAKEHGRQVTIITYDSFVAQVRAGNIDPKEYDCLILDEVHTALSEKRKETVQKFPDALKLGFTATAEYSASKKVSDLLPHEIHRMNIREAVEEGLITSFSAMIARTQVDLSKVQVMNTGEYNAEQLEKAINIASRNQSAVDLYKRQFSGETAVAYCVSVKHAEAVAKLLNEQGVSAAVISGGTSLNEQRRIKQEFKAGKVKILCNADILIPGFDEPRASVCLNLRPTHSRVIAEQRGGRVLRLDEKKPKKHARIVDFIDRGIEESNPSVLFADIAEGAHFEPRDKGMHEGGGGTGKPPTPIVDIPGLEVITDMEEVMRIVGKYRETPQYEQRSRFLPFKILETQVRAEGIKSMLYYARVYSSHHGWPSDPPTVYQGEWLGWPAFFGKEVKTYPPFREFQKAVVAAGIKDSKEYERVYKNHPGWPSVPKRTYRKEWPGWSVLLEKQGFPAFDDLKARVRSTGIKSSKEYPAVYRKHLGWPASPPVIYAKEWRGWKDFLGTEPPAFNDLQTLARLTDIKTAKEYYIVARELDWPVHPNETYVDEWPGWDEFLGKKK